jgi:WD40 repeat protein
MALEESPSSGPDRLTQAPTLAFPPEVLAPGEIPGDRYRIHSLLGRGGMGEVWRAFDLKLRVDVALKALRRELLEDNHALELLRQEVRAAREVVSPNVCRVFDLEELDGQELVSMEYIDGTTLLEILRDRGPLELEEAREIASQFLAGLEAIHLAGLVHRDVKPENIMLTRSGRVVVMDFGVAKRLADEKLGSVAGTPAYMAPEQIKGQQIDAQADVFSAGVVLAEMIAPEGIGSSEAREKVWRGIHHDPPELPDSPWLGVLKRAVTPSLEERHASASVLARALEEVTLRIEGADEVQPYPGLAAFTEEDAEYFFGRELEVEEMWKKLRRPHLLALIGPSGAGKSSFLRAGLIPTIPEGWRVVISTPGNRPFRALAQRLVPEFEGDTEAMTALLDLEEMEVAVPLVARWRERHNQALVIVDQFEELFTQNPVEVQTRFAELLGRLALEADVHVLLSMRDDFLFHCHSQKALSPIFSELTPIGPPAGAALRRAVVQPALKCGYRFEDEELVAEILAEVEEERGALPMLAFAAARLWEKRDRESGLLTRKAYGDIGGVSGSLAQHAEGTLERIGSDRIPIVREIFRNLVTAQGTRAARDREELLSVFGSEETAGTEAGEGGDREAATQVLNGLIDARLLTSYEVPPAEEEDTGHHRIEIIHESLLANWPRLVRWQSQDADSALLRDELRQAAQTWDQHERAEDLLWTGTAFREYQLWRERYPGGLTETEESFAQAMTSHAQRRKRRRRIAVVTIIVILLGVVGIVGTLWRQSEASRRQAVAAEQEAQAEALRAEAAKLLALGQLALEEYPTAAVAYALESLELSDTSEARRFALEALWRGPTAVILAPRQSKEESDQVGGYWSHRLAFSPDGEWMAVAGFGGRGQLWSADGQTRSVFQGHEGEPSWPMLRFGDRSDLLLSGAGRTIRIWSVPGTRELHTLEFEQPTWFQLVGDQLFTFARVDGDRFQIQSRPLAGGEPKTLGRFEGRGWELDALGRWLAYYKDQSVFAVPVEGLPGAQPRLVGRHDEPIRSFWFTPDGNRIASLAEGGDIRIWSLAGESKEPLRVLDDTEAQAWLAFHPSGSLLAARSGYRSVHLWDFTGPPDADPMVLRRGKDTSRTGELAFHPSGQWLATANQQDVALWPLSRRYSSVLRRRDEGHFGILAFTADGRWLAEAAAEGDTLRLWPLSLETAESSRVPLEVGLGEFPSVRVDRVGRRLLVAGSSGRLWLVPWDEGQPQALATDFTSPLSAVAFDPLRRRAAVAIYLGPTAEKVIRVLDLESGEVQVLGPPEGAGDGDQGSTIDMKFTPDGRLLSCGAYGLMLWNLEDGSGEMLDRDRGRWNPAGLAVTPEGRFALVLRLLEDTTPLESVLTLYDLEDGSSRAITSHGQWLWMASSGLAQ